MVSTEKGERRARAPEQTAAILQATLELLREGGNQAVTTESVASRAGVSKTTIYRRWRSRSEMIVAAAKLLMAPIEVPDLGDLHAEVRYLLSRRLEQYQRQGVGEVMSSILGASIEDAQVSAVFSDWVTTQSTSNGDVLVRAIGRGELPADVDKAGMVTLMGAVLFYRLIVEGRKPDTQLMDTVLSVLETFKVPRGRQGASDA